MHMRDSLPLKLQSNNALHFLQQIYASILHWFDWTGFRFFGQGFRFELNGWLGWKHMVGRGDPIKSVF